MRILANTTGVAAGGEDESIRRALVMFRRVLPGWAGDLMALRRLGLDRPTPRRVVRPLAVPGWGDSERRAG